MSLRIPIIILVISVAMAGLSEPARGDTGQVDRLIHSLGDPDPRVRQRASDELISLGIVARPEVLKATGSPDPEVRLRAGRVLLQLPWHLPNDPPAARQILFDYGKKDTEGRKTDIRKLGEARAWDALLRLLREEPAETAQWTIVQVLRQSHNPEHLQKLRQMEIPPDSAPATALAGWAWRPQDIAKSADLFRQAIEIQSSRPAMNGAEVDWIFRVLVSDAVDAQRFEEAAQWLRRQAIRQPRDKGFPSAVAELFVLHSNFGPLPGLEQDLQTNASYLGRPEIIYTIGRIYERMGQFAAAQASYRAAFAANLASITGRYSAGDFLLAHGWYDLAGREWQSLLQMKGPQIAVHHCNAHLRLAQCAAGREDDTAIVEHLTAAIEIKSRTPGAAFMNANETAILTEIQWRSLRAARARQDAPAIHEHLTKLLALSPNRMDAVIDIVPILKEMNRPDDAKAIFERSYEELKQQLANDPTDPELLNNLAWLCARCDERLEEALNWANQAVAAQPNNFAYIDTAAEANFRLGRVEEAIKLETRALELKPNNKFMLEQLKRFREGR